MDNSQFANAFLLKTSAETHFGSLIFWRSFFGSLLHSLNSGGNYNQGFIDLGNSDAWLLLLLLLIEQELI